MSAKNTWQTWQSWHTWQTRRKPSASSAKVDAFVETANKHELADTADMANMAD